MDLSMVNSFPSSKTCSNCRWIKQDLKLSIRECTCESCDEVHDRDINTAKNILKQDINILFGCEMQSDTKQKRSEALSLDESVTPEAQPIASGVGSSHIFVYFFVYFCIFLYIFVYLYYTTCFIMIHKDVRKKLQENGYYVSSILHQDRVIIAKDEKYGFADSNGNIVIKCKYDNVGNFSEDNAVIILDGKWGSIDRNDNEVIKPIYDWVGPFIKGQAKVMLNGELFIIEK